MDGLTILSDSNELITFKLSLECRSQEANCHSLHEAKGK